MGEIVVIKSQVYYFNKGQIDILYLKKKHRTYVLSGFFSLLWVNVKKYNHATFTGTHEELPITHNVLLGA